MNELPTLPAILLDGLFVFPNCENYISLDNGYMRTIVLRSLQSYEGNVLIFPAPRKGEIGTLAKVAWEFLLSEDPNSLEMIIRGLRRIKVKGVARVRSVISDKSLKVDEEGIVELEYELLEEKKESQPQELTEKLVRFVPELLEKNRLSSVEMTTMINGNALDLIDFIAQNSREIDNETRYRLLAELDPAARLELLINLPNPRKIDSELDALARKTMRKEQDAYFLLKKKEAIEKKLKEMRGYGGEEIRKHLSRLEKEPFPKHVKDYVYQKIEQFELAPSNSTEANMIRVYIDWVMKTPWYAESEEIKDLEYARAKLNEKHYGLTEIKERIIEYLAARQRAGESLGQVICLVGAPGVGKTSIAASIAEALGRQFAIISLAGINDEANLRGHISTYVGSFPGRIVKALVRAQTLNPLILLDEIDKLSSSHRGDPTAVLLEVLESKQNKNFVDSYLGDDLPLDLSKVFFLCTANSLDQIPLPLWDRLEKIQIPNYSEEEKAKIAEQYLIPESVKKYNLSDINVKFEKEALQEIIRFYTIEAGVRSLKKKVEKIMRKFIVQLIKAEKTELVLTREEVKGYLGPRKYHSLALKSLHPGMFLFLTASPLGGSVEPVEVVYYSKSVNESEVTGSFRDVAKESIRIALTYIRANSAKFGIDPSFFIKNRIHINAWKGGGMPKDGPSAGLSFTIAILSAILHKSMPRTFAATGEITLGGDVGEIGGLREKLSACIREGVTTVFIPKENKDDEEITEEIKSQLKIIPVDNFEEVWEILFRGSPDTLGVSPKAIKASPKVKESKKTPQPSKRKEKVSEKKR